MNLTLSLSYQEQNDNKAIVLTDTSNYDHTEVPNLVSGNPIVVDTLYEIVTAGATNFTTVGCNDNNPGSRFIWSGAPGSLGVGDELKQVTALVSELTAITLDTTITKVDNSVIIADQVDLYALNTGPFTDISELVFTVTSTLLGLTADSLLPDGLYALEYNVTYTGTDQNYSEFNTQKLEVTILVYGQVKVATYEKLRNISVLYMCNDGCPSPEISEADLCGAYLSSIENSAYVAKTEELLNMLVVLDNIIKNGSNITW